MKNIAILVETSSTWGRMICHGIGNYIRRNTNWHLFIQPRGERENITLPEGWKGDGIIARVNRPEILDSLSRHNIPIVNISGQVHPWLDIPRVAPNDKSTVSCALEHMLDLGITNFGFSGDDDYATKRYEICREKLAESGHECKKNPATGTVLTDKWSDRLNKTAEWIKTLKKPVGIFSWGNIEARHVVDACIMGGFQIPEEVAVMGILTDELLGEINRPTLSAVAVPMLQQGFEAAKMLDTLMKGKTPETKELWLEPLGVNERESTDVVGISDKEVRKALLFIRENAHTPIDVSDVVNTVNISRRTLERRFMKSVGRSPADEIRRVRLDRAKDLLMKTNMTVQEIAQASGWNYAEQMIPFFKQKMGVTPMEYRKMVQSK